MKAALPSLAVILALVASPAFSASSADCGLIRDNDKRRACYAERDRRPSECNLIRDNDERRLCRVRAERR